MLLCAATICLLVFIKVILITQRFIRHKITAFREGKIWIDRYWERRQGREIRTFASILWRFILYCFLMVIVMYALKIVHVYGFTECWDSLYKAFRGLFV